MVLRANSRRVLTTAMARHCLAEALTEDVGEPGRFHAASAGRHAGAWTGPVRGKPAPLGSGVQPRTNLRYGGLQALASAARRLAHMVPDAVVRAYKRTEFIEMRRRLLEAWGTFVTSAL